MRVTKAVLKKLELDEIFAFEGEVFDGKAPDWNINRSQEGLWESILTNNGRNETFNALKSIILMISSQISSNKYEQIDNDKFKISKLVAPYIKNHEKFRQFASSDLQRIVAIGLVFISGNQSTIPTETSSAVAALVAVKSQMYNGILHDMNPYRRDLEVAGDAYDKKTNDFDESIKLFEERMNSLESLYSNKMKLEAPYNYIEKKARNHGWVAFFSGSISLTILCLPIIFIIYYGVDTPIKTINDISSEKIYIYGIIILSLIGSAAWIIRLISRIYIQNLNLYADAKHRAVLVRLFLALQNEGGVKADEKERVLLLNALFRPIGESKDDDLAPPSLLDLLQKPKS